VEIRLDGYIRIIVVLIGGRLIGIYFLYLLYVIYYSITTHLRQDKKVNILPPGDVNPGPIPSGQGLLVDSPYRAVGVVCLLCD
jgi:hypothetical protein